MIVKDMTGKIVGEQHAGVHVQSKDGLNWKLAPQPKAWSRTITTERCLAALNKEGVPSSAYRTVAEALADPQLSHRGALADVEDAGGTFKVLNLPFRMSGARIAAVPRMSALGEHTRELRTEAEGSDPPAKSLVAQPR